MKTLFSFFLFVHYVYSATYYQLMPKYSLNFKNVNFPINAIKHFFNRNGDIVIDNQHLIMTPYINNSNGAIVTKDAFNSSIFEMHINIKRIISTSRASKFNCYYYTGISGKNPHKIIAINEKDCLWRNVFP